jgi:lysozyme
MTCTQEWAEARLTKGLSASTCESIKLTPVLVLASDPRLAAITDFIYNLGATRYKGSTLRKRIAAQDWAGAMKEIVKWNKGGGRVLPGLVLRRAAEAALLK